MPRGVYPRGPHPAARRAAQREALLHAAVEVLSSPAPTMEAVARRARLGKTTLYRHFPTLDALERALRDRFEARLTAALPDEPGTMPPHARLRALAEAVAGASQGVPAACLERSSVLRTALRELLDHGRALGTFAAPTPLASEPLLAALAALVRTAPESQRATLIAELFLRLLR